MGKVIPYQVEPVLVDDSLRKAFSIVRLNDKWWMKIPLGRFVAFALSLFVSVISLLMVFLEPLVQWVLGDNVSSLHYVVLFLVLSWLFHKVMGAFSRMRKRHARYREDPRFKILKGLMNDIESFNRQVGSFNAWIFNLRGKDPGVLDEFLVSKLHKREIVLVQRKMKMSESVARFPLGTVEDPLKVKALLEVLL